MDNTLMSSTTQGLASTCFRAATLPERTAARVICALVVAVFAGLAGCASDSTDHIVEINGQSPVPVVDTLPLTVAVHYTPELLAYTSRQESLNGDSWQVAFGQVQRDDIHRMLTSVFENVVESPTANPPSDLGHDILIIPRIENFSFLTPAESGTNFFAVSMRHFVSFYDAGGKDFGEWEINSYGRSRSYFGRRLKAMAEEACVDAMRDLATSLVIGLPKEIVSRDIVDVEGLELTGALQ